MEGCAMKKVLFIFVIFLMSLCVFAEDGTVPQTEMGGEPEKVAETLGDDAEKSIPKERVVVARGYATVRDNDFAKARDEAIKDAQVKALEQVVGVFVEADTYAKDYEALNKNIYTNTKGYIASYTVIEGRDERIPVEDSIVYCVTIEAKVKLKDLRAKLEEITHLYDKIGKPKFFVVATASSNVGGDDRDLIEGAMIEHLQKMDFDIIDKTMISLQIESNPNLSNLLRTMKEHKIKILVMINADSTNKNIPSGDILSGIFNWGGGRWGLGRLADTNTVTTKLSLKFIDTETEEVFYNKNISSSDFALSITESNRKTVEDAINNGMNKFFTESGDELKKALVERWAEVENRNTFILSIEGLDRKSFMFVKDQIRQKDRFIKSVTNEIFRDMKASWEIATMTDKNTFMDYLESIDYEGRHIIITGIYGNNIDAKLN